MCPACITTVTLAVVGTTSAGGLTALLATKVWGRRRDKARLDRAPSHALRRRIRERRLDMEPNPAVSREEWVAARTARWVKEKELTRLP